MNLAIDFDLKLIAAIAIWIIGTWIIKKLIKGVCEGNRQEGL